MQESCGSTAKRSASDSNFPCGKEEWPACSGRSGDDLPRPILIFFAATKNGPLAAAVAATIFRVRFKFSLRQQRMVSPADRRRKVRAASILDFKPRLGNHCRFLPGNDLQRAAILDFRGVNLGIAACFARKSPLACSDSGFQAQTWESLQVFARKSPLACSDS